MYTLLLRSARTVLLFIVVYYALYALLFMIPWHKKPLLTRLQEGATFYRDAVGKTIDEFDGKKQYDIIFFGSSHCYRTFDPKYFENLGLNTYNLGSSAQTPLNSYSLIKYYGKYTRNVILEVYPAVADYSGAESFFDFVQASSGTYRVCLSMAKELNDLRCYNMLSVKPFFDAHNKYLPYSNTKIYKGYAETDNSTKAATRYETRVLNKQRLNMQLLYVEKIIRYCLLNSINIVLTYAPVPPQLVLVNEYYYTAGITLLCEKYHIPFFNYGRHHCLNAKNLFYDSNHLNKAGVKLFNEKFYEDARPSIK